MSFSPVVTGTSLSENKVIRSEELSEGTSSHGVHCSRFEIHQDGSGYVTSTGSFIEVYIDSFELEIGVSVVGSCGVNTVLI